MALQLASSSKLVRTSSTRSNRKPASTVCLSNDIDNSLPWTEKYRPRELKDVPITAQKIKSVKDWLTTALEMHSCYYDMGITNGPPSFLALCGTSGCCKTKVVELLCAEEGVEILTWSSDMWQSDIVANTTDFTALNNSSISSLHLSNISGRNFLKATETMYEVAKQTGYSSAASDLFKDEGMWYSKSEVLENFSLKSRYPSLSLQRTAFPSTHSEQLSKRTGSNRGHNSSIGGGSSSYNLTEARSGSAKFLRKILLIKDPPTYDNIDGVNKNSAKMQQLYNFILSVQCPVIMILSNISGRDDLMFATDRCLPRSVRERVQFDSIYFLPITELKITKVLNNIIRAENLTNSANSKVYFDSLVNEIAVCAMGDIRHAVLQLQISVSSLMNRNNVDGTCLPLQRSQSVPIPSSPPLNNSTSNSHSGTFAKNKRLHKKVSKCVFDSDNTNSDEEMSRRYSRNKTADQLDRKGHGVYEASSGSDEVDRKSKRFRAALATKPKQRKHSNMTAFDTDYVNQSNRAEVIDLLSSSSDEDLSETVVKLKDANFAGGIERSSCRHIIQSSEGEEEISRAMFVDNQVDDLGQKALKFLDNTCPFEKKGTNGQVRRGRSEGSLLSTNVTEFTSISTRAGIIGVENCALKTNTSIITHPARSNPPGVLGKRDSSFSSLHSVAKILTAKLDNRGRPTFDLDSVVDRSELDLELMLPFIQWNSVPILNATPRIYEQMSESDIARKELAEIEFTLNLLSEVDIYSARKYDVNSSLDRSGSSCFPDGYISALLSRAPAVGRGIGSYEQDLYAANKGFKKPFLGIHRPKSIDLRAQQLAVRSKLGSLQEELLGHLLQHAEYDSISNSSNVNADFCAWPGGMVGKRDFVLTTVPYFKTIKEYSNQFHITTNQPIYSALLDWHICHLYSQSEVVPTHVLRQKKLPTTSIQLDSNRDEESAYGFGDEICDFD